MDDAILNDSENGDLKYPISQEDYNKMKLIIENLENYIFNSYGDIEKNRQYKIIKKLEDIYLEHEKLKTDLTSNLELIKNETDESMISMINDDINIIREQIKKNIQEFHEVNIQEEEYESGNCILEVRAGTGGMEAALFATELMNMYILFAEGQKWKYEYISLSKNEINGLREGIVKIMGKGAYKYLQHESGVHRVQRVPETEASGRIHTSTASVAIFPEKQASKVRLKNEDLRIDVYRASGAGGQHVNTTESAVRITHLPTGIVVQEQSERSQHRNKDKAMVTLEFRVNQYYINEERNKETASRSQQVGTSERCEKIRTYNFPQNRVTDHRINHSVFDIGKFMIGEYILEFFKLLHVSNKKTFLSEIL